MGLPTDVPVKVVLEQDGTEIDDDEYFNTMERNTTLMILINDQKWLPPGKLPRLEKTVIVCKSVSMRDSCYECKMYWS